jgi:hypothetical protein
MYGVSLPTEALLQRLPGRIFDQRFYLRQRGLSRFPADIR